MLFINVTQNKLTLRSYESKAEFVDLLTKSIVTHPLHPLTEEGCIHGVCWLYDHEDRCVDRKSIELIPYYDFYCEDDKTHDSGTYLKFKYVGESEYVYSKVCTDQEDAESTVRYYRNQWFGTPEKRAMRLNVFENLFPETYQHFADQAYDSDSKENEYGTVTYVLYDEFYHILCSLID